MVYSNSMTTPRLTPNQKDRIWLLGRKSATIFGAERPGKWVSAKECGGPSALEHLYHKGYADRHIVIGPRGGEILTYRLNDLGWAEYDKISKKKQGETVRRLLTGEIDTRIINARKEGRVVRIIADGKEYRGVPGEVGRTEDWERTLVLNIGQRQIPLFSITDVIE